MANDSRPSVPVPGLRRYARRAQVDAVQLAEGEDWAPIAEWCGGRVTTKPEYRGAEPAPCIEFEGREAWARDWIVCYQTEDGPSFEALDEWGFDETFESTPPETAQVTEYRLSLLTEADSTDYYAWDINVSWRGGDRWAVKHHSLCLGNDGHWDYERSPSGREDEWVETHRFDLPTALRLAHGALPHVVVNGLSPADILARSASSPVTEGEDQ